MMIKLFFRGVLMPLGLISGIWLAIILYMQFTKVIHVYWEFGIAAGITGAVTSLFGIAIIRSTETGVIAWGFMLIMSTFLFASYFSIIVYLDAMVHLINLSYSTDLIQKFPMALGVAVWFIVACWSLVRTCFRHPEE